ncbi:energy transducer TonB [Ignatzschineria indica]|uniref:energy transducer TonB n=1 Tax=Ignatzschineria indica TaxID=472583 RepID=UPI002577841D|nr:TonB family protein [Ignatzschineria indica]
MIAILASLLLNGGLLCGLLFSLKADQLILAQNAGTVEGEQYLSIQLLSQSPSLETNTEVEVAIEADPKEKSEEKRGEQVIDPMDPPQKEVKKGREDRKSLESQQQRADTKNLAKRSVEPNKNPAPQKQNSKTESLAKEAPAVEKGENKGRSGDQFAQSLMNTILYNIEGCYPEASKRRGEEGTVELALQLKGGHIEVIVLKSSGYGRLDRCAITSVERALKKSQIKELPAKRVKLKPIRFQLR